MLLSYYVWFFVHQHRSMRAMVIKCMFNKKKLEVFKFIAVHLNITFPLLEPKNNNNSKIGFEMKNLTSYICRSSQWVIYNSLNRSNAAHYKSAVVSSRACWWTNKHWRSSHEIFGGAQTYVIVGIFLLMSHKWDFKCLINGHLQSITLCIEVYFQKTEEFLHKMKNKYSFILMCCSCSNRRQTFWYCWYYLLRLPFGSYLFIGFGPWSRSRHQSEAHSPCCTFLQSSLCQSQKNSAAHSREGEARSREPCRR